MERERGGVAVAPDVRTFLQAIRTTTKTQRGTPAERGVQRQELIAEQLKHGRAYAFMTPNVRTSSAPILLALAFGPGDGDLVAEPTRRGLGPLQPLIRLSDLTQPQRSYFDQLVTFARDPWALGSVHIHCRGGGGGT